MIVKNEEHIIERSLKSLIPFIDMWCIVDTGSTDKTQDKIREILSAIPGVLHERPWVNFGHNRTEALELARKSDSDWLLMMDADDIFNGPQKLNLDISVDGYTVPIKYGNLRYGRPQIFKSSVNWKFIGALHEYAHSPNSNLGILKDYWIDASCEGGRSKNPNKYRDDALLLEKELETQPGNPRSLFYAAQSWRDAGNKEKSIEFYTKRISAGGWPQEIYISYLNLIRFSDNPDDVFKYAWKAQEVCKNRLEAAHAALSYLRKKNMWSLQAYSLGKLFSDIREPPSDGLFVETDVYTYSFQDEFAIHSFYTSHYEDSAKAAYRSMKNAPPAQKARIRENLGFALDK